MARRSTTVLGPAAGPPATAPPSPAAAAASPASAAASSAACCAASALCLASSASSAAASRAWERMRGLPIRNQASTRASRASERQGEGLARPARQQRLLQERALGDQRRGVLGDGMDLERLGLARAPEEPLPGHHLDAAEPGGAGLDDDGGRVSMEGEPTVGVEREDLDVQRPVAAVVDGQLVDGRPSPACRAGSSSMPSSTNCPTSTVPSSTTEPAGSSRLRTMTPNGIGPAAIVWPRGGRKSTRTVASSPGRRLTLSGSAVIHAVRLAQPGELELVNDAAVVAHPDLQLRLSARLDVDRSLREGRRSTHTGQGTALLDGGVGSRGNPFGQSRCPCEPL